MDNLLTPSKISRLISYAEDKSLGPDKIMFTKDEIRRAVGQMNASRHKPSTASCETSSGILDLDKIEGFGDSRSLASLSLNKSTTFSPAEMTGRSTGATEMSGSLMPPPSRPYLAGASGTSGSRIPPPRGSYLDPDALGGLFNRMQQQTKEVNDVLRDSIASSFQCKPNLTADEACFVPKDVSIPASFSTQPFQESMSVNNSNLSVGAYFKNKCQNFSSILTHTDSPDTTDITANTNVTNTMPSISEVSCSIPYEVNQNLYNLKVDDDILDTIPVKQPANSPRKPPEKSPRKSKLPQSQTTMKTVTEIPKQITENARPVPKVFEKPRLPNPTVVSAHKSFMYSSKPSDVVLKNLHSSLMPTPENHGSHQGSNDTEASLEKSVSLSAIADYLGRESDISVTDVLKLNRKGSKNPPNALNADQEMHVTYLKDAQKSDTASSVETSSSLQTVLDRLKVNVPTVIVTKPTSKPEEVIQISDDDIVDVPPRRSPSPYNRSPSPNHRSPSPNCRSPSPNHRSPSPNRRSPSPNHRSPLPSRGSMSPRSLLESLNSPPKKSNSPSKTPTSLSTVRDMTGFKSSESPDVTYSKGESRISMFPTSNVLPYKELDKSVDWQDIFRQTRLKQYGVDAQMSIDAQGWADIIAHNVEGYVGISCPATISVTTHTDSWLTAVLQFDEFPNPNDINIELSRVPILLSPRKCEKFTCNLTANIEIVTALPFVVSLKDASFEGVIEQRGELPVKFVAPRVQAHSTDGVDKLVFPAIQEGNTFTKSFVLVSDCSVALKLKLSVVEGDILFFIKSVSVINRNNIEQALNTEEQSEKRTKRQNATTQLCGLGPEEALKVVVVFTAPKLADLNIMESSATFNGLLNVNLITSNVLLNKIKLIGSVGLADLVINVKEDTLHVKNEPTTITVTNVGSALGSWIMKYICEYPNFPFKITPAKFDIPANGCKTLTITYLGQRNPYAQATLKFKETTTGLTTSIDIVGGDKLKLFPIKTNHTVLSWVQPGRKEISLKNDSDKRVRLKCNLQGEGFFIDMPDVPRNMVLSFEPQQCLTLPIAFKAYTSLPCKAVMNLVHDRQCARKIKLFGCVTGEFVRWSGLMTYASTALVQAACRAPIQLQLYNRAHTPAFVAARVQFNLQYLTAASTSYLEGAPHIIPGRAHQNIVLHVDWPKVERRRIENPSSGNELATVTIVTGAEYTRRRILRVLREESSDGEPDLTLLPEYLRALAGPFDNEDHNLENLLEDFGETKECLSELLSGVHDLNAHVVLPQDIGDEHTIILCDDTMLQHRTLLE